MACQYNDPSVFKDSEKFVQLRKLRKQLENEKKILLDRTKWGKRHPHEIALSIQIKAREIGVLFDEIKPRAAEVDFKREDQPVIDRGLLEDSLVG